MSNKSSDNNKRIAKNTLYLYIRMFVMMAVGLYTSRLVLKVLGVTDYGVYNIVGGVVAFLSFMNGALVNATQRFMNYALGKNDDGKFREVFCMSLNMYAVWGLVAMLLAETLGVWFVNTQLNIPADRMVAANWVFQFSVLAFVANLLRTPYHSAVLAHERMDFFARVSVVEALLKLLIVYMLLAISFDKLILYSCLYTIVILLMNGCYYVYCRHHFPSTRYVFMWDRKMFKEFSSFSFLSLLGNLAGVVVQQGINIILNMFYGVTVNAAAGLANQVSAQVYGFVTNFQTAFQPQIVKSFAANKYGEFHSLICHSAKFSYFLLFLIAFPLLLTTTPVFKLWLTDVPQYAVEFSQMILVFQLVDVVSTPLWMATQAQGDIKKYQIVVSALLVLSLPLGYLALRLGCPPYFVWGARILVSVFSLGYRLLFLRQKVNLKIRRFVFDVIWPIVLVTLLALPVPLFVKYSVNGEVLNFVCVLVCCELVALPLIALIGLSTSERNFFLGIIKSKIRK